MLCRSYWYPLYVFVRRQGLSPEDAQDLTQDFFGRLLRPEFLRNVAPEKGLFRSFLLACLKRFLADEWRKEHAAKRGGGQPLLPLEEERAESRYLQEPYGQMSPEALYERRWALALLDRVLNRLEAEFAAAGKQALFQGLEHFLAGDKSDGTYAEAATRLGLTEGAVKMTTLRMRERYRVLFRDEIAQTVAAPAEVDDEIRHVIAVLRQ